MSSQKPQVSVKNSLKKSSQHRHHHHHHHHHDQNKKKSGVIDEISTDSYHNHKKYNHGYGKSKQSSIMEHEVLKFEEKSDGATYSALNTSPIPELSQCKEIELLREKINKLENSINFLENTKSQEDIHGSCFSFFNRKKDNKNHTFLSSQIIDDLKKDNFSKSSIPTKNKRKTKKEHDQKHNITNNNTIVLPESYSSNSAETIKNIYNKLEEHGRTIVQIKNNVNECVQLLRMFTESKSLPPYKNEIFLDKSMEPEFDLNFFKEMFPNSMDTSYIKVSKKCKANNPPSVEIIHDNSLCHKSTLTQESEERDFGKATYSAFMTKCEEFNYTPVSSIRGSKLTAKRKRIRKEEIPSFRESNFSNESNGRRINCISHFISFIWNKKK